MFKENWFHTKIPVCKERIIEDVIINEYSVLKVLKFIDEREKIVRLYFDIRLKRHDLGIDTIFSEDVIYIYSLDPKYENCQTLKHWSNEWNIRGKVAVEDIEENTNDTGKESVNDQPTNIDDYIIVKFHHKNEEGSSSIVYLYKDKNSRYVE